ncbi:PepSY-like domain-containing protein [Pedobacter sp.]|uniref:PepSY-like domain-containing protein n=1 Tax=Pedobacter sp. TaxID=1411316 RepID=UPI00396C6438
MKKGIQLMLALGIMAIGANAQKVNESKVPANVKSAFQKAHPGVTGVKWEMEKDNYEAAFTANDVKTSEVYNAKGQLQETEVALRFNDLPEAVRAKLKGLKVTETAKITKANGQVVFEAEVKGKDLLFDEKGNLIKP